MILSRTVIVPDPFARANVLEALAGPGAPAGITACAVVGATLEIAFDAERTAAELVDALIEIGTAFVPARAAFADPTAAVAIAAAGLHEPALDATRIIETYLT